MADATVLRVIVTSRKILSNVHAARLKQGTKPEAIANAFKKSPIIHVKKMINKKYTFTILLHIWFLKQHRFGELNSIRTMNSKTLTFTLKNMVKNELIRKKIYQTSPRITKYFITKKGKALIRVYISMINFVMENYSKEILVDEKPKKLEDLLSKEMLKILNK